MVSFQLLLVVCVSVEYLLEVVGGVVDAPLAEELVCLADFLKGLSVRPVELGKEVANDCQLVEPDGELYFWIFHRVPLLSIGKLLACQRRSVFDCSSHFRVSVREAAVVAILAISCLLPVLAHNRLVVGRHFGIVEHSRKHLREFGARDDRCVCR